MGLSETVAAVVDEATNIVESLVEKVRNGEWPEESSGLKQ
jgi:hypothetical protein